MNLQLTQPLVFSNIIINMAKQALIICLSLSILVQGIKQIPVQSSGVQPCGLTIRWKINGDSIEWTYEVPSDITSAFGWVGMGIKESINGDNMVNADLTSINLATGEVADRHAVQNGYPPPDEEQGGTNDATGENQPPVAGQPAVFNWTKKLNTGDTANDALLVAGNSYLLLWAYGQVNGELIMPHTDKGLGNIVLTPQGAQEGSCEAPAGFLVFK